MNEYIVPVLAIIGGTAGGMGAEWLRGRATRGAAAAQSNGAIGVAEIDLDGKILANLSARVDKLETQLATALQQIGRLRLMLERVGHEYETARKLLGRVAKRLRSGQDVEDDMLLEMENAPDFGRVLAGFEERPLPDFTPQEPTQ